MASDFFGQYSRLALVTALSSIALSIWCVWADPVVNNDGVYYFRAAEKILAGSWRDAISVYSWPFYPAFIAYLSKLTGADVVTSAHVLNALLCAVLVVGFLAVVFELGADRRTLIFAAIIILAFPTLNKFRPFIIRDIGYLAFYLWSLKFLFSYWKSKDKRALLGWFLLALFAAQFRIEGIAMLVAVPIIVFSLERVYSSYRWWILSLYVIGGVFLFLILATWMLRDQGLFSTGGWQRPQQIWDVMVGYFGATVGAKLELLKEQFAGRYYWLVYIMIIVFVTLAEVVRRLAVVYALVALWGLKRDVLFPKRQLKPLWLALILVNILILVGSAFFKSIVVDRYALTTAVTVLLACPFVFSDLWEKWKNKELVGYPKVLFPALVVVSLVIGVKGLDVFTDKRYLYQAGNWIAENTAEDATLHSNNLILIYYSGKDAYHDNYSWRYTYTEIKSKKWKEKYDYLAIELNRGDYPLIEWLNIHLQGTPIKRFDNADGDSVLIYENNT